MNFFDIYIDAYTRKEARIDPALDNLKRGLIGPSRNPFQKELDNFDQRPSYMDVEKVRRVGGGTGGTPIPRDPRIPKGWTEYIPYSDDTRLMRTPIYDYRDKTVILPKEPYKPEPTPYKDVDLSQYTSRIPGELIHFFGGYR